LKAGHSKGLKRNCSLDGTSKQEGVFEKTWSGRLEADGKKIAPEQREFLPVAGFHLKKRLSLELRGLRQIANSRHPLVSIPRERANGPQEQKLETQTPVQVPDFLRRLPVEIGAVKLTFRMVQNLFGLIEIIIGGITLLALTVSSALSFNTKPANVFAFVTLTGTTSMLIGIGILLYNRLAYQLLLYFSSVIILSKVLILSNIIQLTGSLETAVPLSVKSWISIFYHGFVIYYLCMKEVRDRFGE